MPMIDVYDVAGTFREKHKLAQDLAKAVMKWENVPPIDLFKKNTAAFIHDLPAEAISNAAGESRRIYPLNCSSFIPAAMSSRINTRNGTILILTKVPTA